MRLLLAAILAVQSAGPSASIYGAYQDCPFHCRTIQVRPDGTFVYRLDGDLYNDERVAGTWTWLGDGRLRATSPENTTPPTVAETSDPREAGFRVSVVDEHGALVRGAELTPLAPERGAPVATDEAGGAELPRCAEFEVKFQGYRGRYRPKDPASNRFEVTLSNEQLGAWTVDDVWLVRDGTLYVAADDGSFDMELGLRKLSRKQERKIFGAPRAPDAQR
jgi:hypothetical protein